MRSRQAEVDLYKTRLEQRAKNYERLKGFYKRQLDKKEKYANELRVELNEARNKLEATEYSTKKAERNINVAKLDLKREQKQITQSLAKQVGNVATLLANVRGMRAESATSATTLQRAGCLREAKLAAGNLLRFLTFFVSSLIQLTRLHNAGPAEQSCWGVGTEETGNQLKRQANKKTEKQTRLLLNKQQGSKEAIATEDQPDE
jgi:hypothetical protein